MNYLIILLSIFYSLSASSNGSLIDANEQNPIEVTLSNIDQFPVVVASENENSVERFIIPRGTKALVIKWSDNFLTAGNFNIFDVMYKKTKVKIINGPLQGRELYIDNMYIEIE